MTLTKQKMIREIGRRKRLRNRDVQAMLEALIEIWSEELVNGGRIELEHFFVIETQVIDRGLQTGTLKNRDQQDLAPRLIRRIIVRGSKHLKHLLRGSAD